MSDSKTRSILSGKQVSWQNHLIWGESDSQWNILPTQFSGQPFVSGTHTRLKCSFRFNRGKSLHFLVYFTIDTPSACLFWAKNIALPSSPTTFVYFTMEEPSDVFRHELMLPFLPHFGVNPFVCYLINKVLCGKEARILFISSLCLLPSIARGVCTTPSR